MFLILLQISLSNQLANLKTWGRSSRSACKFSNHIESLGKKALSTLGFINRSLTFINPTTYILSYNTLVRSILEYASSIWCPYLLYQINYSESIQHKFLRRLAFLNDTPMCYTNHNYTFIEQRFCIPTLERRRKISYMIFLFKILYNEIDCPKLRSLITLRTSARVTRQNYLFVVKFYRLFLTSNNVISRMVHLGNQFHTSIDFFTSSLSTFCKYVKTLPL